MRSNNPVFVIVITLTLSLTFSGVLIAQPLIKEIKTFARKQFISKDNNLVLSVELLTPTGQLSKICQHPEWAFIGEMTRLAGPHTLSATCGKKRYFIGVNFSVSGTYWIARHPLRSGQVIAEGEAFQTALIHKLINRKLSDMQ